MIKVCSRGLQVNRLLVERATVLTIWQMHGELYRPSEIARAVRVPRPNVAEIIALLTQWESQHETQQAISEAVYDRICMCLAAPPLKERGGRTKPNRPRSADDRGPDGMQLAGFVHAITAH